MALVGDEPIDVDCRSTLLGSWHGQDPATMVRQERFSDQDFLRLWGEHGADWTWQQYADALSDLLGLEGSDRLAATLISVRVARRRQLWRTRHGVDVAVKRVSAARVFAPWPEVAAQYRDMWLYRFLELEAVVLERGAEALPGRRAKDWLTERVWLTEQDHVIRYDPETGFYRSPRDPFYELVGSITETREAYLSRHKSAGRDLDRNSAAE